MRADRGGGNCGIARVSPRQLASARTVGMFFSNLVAESRRTCQPFPCKSQRCVDGGPLSGLQTLTHVLFLVDNFEIVAYFESAGFVLEE